MGSVTAIARAQLLRALCAVAVEAFAARAASVALLDEPAGELVFVAAAGEGASQVDGARFKATEGLAGEVLRTGEPLLLADLDRQERFAHDIAVATGYEPDAMAVMPVGSVGVLSVLDPGRLDERGLAALAAHALASLALAEELDERPG